MSKRTAIPTFGDVRWTPRARPLLAVLVFGLALAVTACGSGTPIGWREQIADDVNREESQAEREDAATWRANLQEERKRVLLQHRYGRIADEEMLEETARIDGLLAALPTPEGRNVERAAQLTAADTLACMRDYWDHATSEQRSEALRTILQPFGLVVDLTTQTLIRIKPRPALIPTFRVVLAHRWQEAEGGWFTRLA